MGLVEEENESPIPLYVLVSGVGWTGGSCEGGEIVAPEDIGWTAGLIDGEGWVGLVYAGNKRRKLTHLRVVVSAVCFGTVRKLQSLWGGVIHRSQRKGGNCKPIHSWVISPKLAVPMLEAIEPYLVEKKEQVFFALLHQETLLPLGHGRGLKRRGLRVGEAVMRFRDELHGRLRSLKRKMA